MNIAIVGATGNVGRKILEVLEKKGLSIDNLYLVASTKSSGKKISFKQDEIKKKGHSIECRINAENPITQLPSTGLIKTYHPPGGPGIRIDSALYTGCNISSFYDGLISKLVCKGNTRHECIMKLKRALDEYVIEGVQTNIPTLKKIIQTSDFIEGNFNINWFNNSIE